MTLTRDDHSPDRRGQEPVVPRADETQVTGGHAPNGGGNGYAQARGYGGYRADAHVWSNGGHQYRPGDAGGGYSAGYRASSRPGQAGGDGSDGWDDEDGDGGEGIGRALFATVASVFLPGVGHAMAGRKRTGRIMLTALFLLVATAAIAYKGLGRARIVALSVDSTALTWLVYGSVGLGLAWALVVVSAFRVNQPDEMTPVERALSGVIVGMLALTLVATGGMVAYYVNTQRDLVTSLAPAGAKKKPNYFAHKPRVNIMLLGSDAGDDRTGVRTDTVIVASIDTKSGRTVMFSLPRNLQRMPFPDGTRAADEFPDGFSGPGSVDFYLLNAVYKYGQEHPNLVPGAANPGAALLQQAVQGTLDLNVDYYVMIDLKGFEGIVDALGGIKVVVKEENGRPIPIGGEHKADGTVVYPKKFLPLGKQKLDGYDALWYARSRFYSDDYHRMARQQCVLGAIARQATPLNVLKGYQKIAKTAKKSIESDIPSEALQSLVTLAATGKTAKITTVSFDNKVIKSADPDYDVVHRAVRQALAEARKDAKPSPTATTSASAVARTPAASTGRPSAQSSSSPAPRPGKAVSVDDICEYW